MPRIEEFLSNDLSLSFYLRNGFQPHPFYYNCSLVDDPWTERHPVLGLYFMGVGVAILSVYLPCLFVISKSDLMKSSCYKIMMYLGLLDACCLIVNSVITGYLEFIGATFCSYPRFIFLAGAIGCGCWMGSCCTCILLAVNRCSDINHNLPFRRMFIGKNVYVTLLIPISYTVYSILFTKPLLFNSNYMSWFFDPFLGLDSNYYINFPHTVNNCCVSVCTTSLYGYLSFLIFLKNRHAQSEALSKTQRQVFIQSVLICSCRAVAAYVYVYMQFFHSSPVVILVGQIAWQCAHSSVCVVYITWNKSVRRKVVQLLIPQRIRNRVQVKVNTTLSASRPIITMVGSELMRGRRATTTTVSGSIF